MGPVIPTGYQRVADVSQLNRGDHIAWYRAGSGEIYHHALVMHVHPDEGEITIIEYQGWVKGSLYGQIVKNKIDPFANLYLITPPGPLYVVNHTDPVYTPDEVIRRAESRLGEQQYMLLYNNCEHFATWAKTGIHASSQVVTHLLPTIVAYYQQMILDIEKRLAIGMPQRQHQLNH